MLESIHIILHILVVIVGIGKEVVPVAEDIRRGDMTAGQENPGRVFHLKHLLRIIVKQPSLFIAQVHTHTGIPFHAHGAVYAHRAMVGGDNDVQKGLNQVKNGNAFVSVGTLESNQTGRVKLEVKLDGNSQDNSYMEKLAQLSIQFATTPKTDFDPQNKTIEKKIHKTRQVVYTIPGGSEIVYIDDDEVPLDGGFNPKTGDSILPLLVCAIALVVGIGFIALYFIIEKKSNREVR